MRTPLLEDVYRVVLPARHRLAKRRAPWCSTTSRTSRGSAARRPARGSGSSATRARFTPAVEYATDDYVAVQSLVAAGLGVSVIPGLAVAHPLPGVEVRALRSGAPVRRISAARPRGGYRGPAVTVMLESLAWSSASIFR